MYCLPVALSLLTTEGLNEDSCAITAAKGIGLIRSSFAAFTIDWTLLSSLNLISDYCISCCVDVSAIASILPSEAPNPVFISLTTWFVFWLAEFSLLSYVLSKESSCIRPSVPPKPLSVVKMS